MVARSDRFLEKYSAIITEMGLFRSKNSGKIVTQGVFGQFAVEYDEWVENHRFAYQSEQ